MQIASLFKNTQSLYFLDIYSVQSHLKIQGKKSYSSLLSLTLSILSLLTIIIISVYFLVSTFQRKAVSVVYNVDSMVYPVVNLTDFPMTFQIYDINGRPLPEQDRIFNLAAIYREYNVRLDENNSPQIMNDFRIVKVQKCDINKHFGKYKEFFLDVPDLSKKYCLPAGSNNITLYGKYGESTGFSLLQFFLVRCMNGINGIGNCYENKVIDDYLSAVQFQVTLMDYDINHNNPDDPRILTRKSEIYQLSSSVFRKISKYLNVVQYFSDYGYIFENMFQLEFHQNDKDLIIDDLRKEGSLKGSFSSFVINCSSKTEKYSRNFIKLQGLLANIGGIINGITVSVKVFHFLFSRNLINFILYNSIFKNLENPEKMEVKNKLKAILNEEVGNINKSQNDSKLMMNLKDNVNNHIIISSHRENIMKNFQGLKSGKKEGTSNQNYYSVFDIVFPSLMKAKKRSVYIFDKFQKWVNCNISLENILERILEIDILKKKLDDLNETKIEKSNSNLNDRKFLVLENNRKNMKLCEND